MVAVALLIPPLMLCLLLALDHLEERLLGRAKSARHARSKRHLRAVAHPAAQDAHVQRGVS